MERGWLVRRSFRSSEGATAAGPERSYQISPTVRSLPPALLHGRESTAPQGFSNECAIACSIVIAPASVARGKRPILTKSGCAGQNLDVPRLNVLHLNTGACDTRSRQIQFSGR